jgi:hypothetical protein
MRNLDAFLEGFTRTADGHYIPKDASHNYYRHYGIKRGGELLLTEDEVLFLYDPMAKESYSLRTKAYFHIRNSFYNLLLDESSRLRLFKKTRDFNRKRDTPVSSLRYVHRDDKVDAEDEDEVLCILSDTVFTFMRSRRVRKLDFSTDEKLRK